MRKENLILSSLTVFLLITASISVVSANTLYVSQENDGYNYTSIQEALGHAHNGDKILVYPGNYTENVAINLTDICILSASGKAADTIVQAEDANESVFFVSADGVKIGGLTIQGSGRAGIELNSSDNHMILSNTITGNEAGILLNLSSGNTVYRNTLDNNYNGITMFDSYDSMIAENLLRNNTMAIINYAGENICFSKNTLNNNLLGFMIYESSNNEATGNTITDCIGGFALGYGNSNNFSKNTIKNTSIGFLLEGSEDNIITENNVKYPRVAVIMNSSADNSFSKNTFTGASRELVDLVYQDELASAFREVLVSAPVNQMVSDSVKGDVLVSLPEALLPANETVSGDSIRAYSGTAVFVISSDRNFFSENTFINNSVGCILQEAENNEFENNCLEDNEAGVIVYLSGNNTFSSNSLENMEYGFVVQGSGHNQFNLNSLKKTEFGFTVQETEYNQFTENKVELSQIPLKMMVGRENKILENTFLNNIAGVMFTDCENSEISGNSMSNGMYGILMFSNNDSTISENEFTNNYIGVMAAGVNRTAFVDNNFSINLIDSTPEDPSDCLLYSSYFENNTSMDKDELFNGDLLLKQNEILEENGFPVNSSLLKQQELLNNDQLFGVKGPFEDYGTYGIILGETNDSFMEGNELYNNHYAVMIFESENSTLSGNWLENNNFGLTLVNSSRSLVYNNYLNNTNNTAFSHEGMYENTIEEPEKDPDCVWNISKTEHENIVEGPYLGGNYWALPNETGFSQTHEDADEDGICDLQYNITEDGLNIDFLPLADAPGKDDNCGGNEEERYNSGESSGGSSQKYLPASSNDTGHSDSSQKKVNAGSEVKFTFREPKNDIYKVSFKSKKYSGIVGIRIGTPDSKEIESIEEAGSEVYRYIEILVGNEAFESGNNIENGSIEFRVPKNWTTEKNLSPETIKLNRLEDEGWKQLKTEKTGEDKDYYYFRTQTPGFSCFAITGQNTVASSSGKKAEDSEGTLTGEAAENLRAENAGEQADKEEKENTPGFGILLSGMGGLLARAYLKRK